MVKCRLSVTPFEIYMDIHEMIESGLKLVMYVPDLTLSSLPLWLLCILGTSVMDYRWGSCPQTVLICSLAEIPCRQSPMSLLRV